MISINYSQIPEYLQRSAFFKSLHHTEGEDDFTDTIEIPENCFKENDVLNSFDDLRRLLKTMLFWGLDTFPVGLLLFLSDTTYTKEHLESLLGNLLDFKSALVDDVVYIFSAKHMQVFKHKHGRFHRAILKGRKELLEFWLANNFYKPTGEDNNFSETTLAAEKGQASCLELLLAHNFPVSDNAAKRACWAGSLSCLEVLGRYSAPINESVYYFVACRGQLSILKFIHMQGVAWNHTLCSEIAHQGHLECLQYAYENGCPLTKEVIRAAANRGHVDCLRYALSHGCGGVSTDAAYLAARNGHCACLQLLHEYHQPWDTWVYAEAARNGHLDCIEYAYKSGLKLVTQPTEEFDLCCNAVQGGNMDVLRFFQEHGVNWDEATTKECVRRNNLTMLRYAIESECPWTGICTKNAFCHGHVEIVEYLLSLSAYVSTQELHCYAAFAAAGNSVRMLEYIIHELHTDLHTLDDGSYFKVAFEGCLFETVKWCIDNSYKFKDYRFDLMGFSDNYVKDADFVACLKYAVKHGWEYSDDLLDFVHISYPQCEAFLLENNAADGAK